MTLRRLLIHNRHRLLPVSGCSSKPTEQAEEAALQADSAELGTNEVAKRKGKLRPVHPWSVSVEYMNSETYKETYGSSLTWQLYRRNMKGPMHMLPKTRRGCVNLAGRFITNHPCPICRDEYLVVDFRNVKLLEQFIIPETGQLVENRKCGVCEREYLKIRVETQKAIDRGYIVFNVPFRNYDYSYYYPWWDAAKSMEPVEDVEKWEEWCLPKSDTSYTVYPVFHPDLFPESRRPRFNPFKKEPYRRR